MQLLPHGRFVGAVQGVQRLLFGLNNGQSKPTSSRFLPAPTIHLSASVSRRETTTLSRGLEARRRLEARCKFVSKYLMS